MGVDQKDHDDGSPATRQDVTTFLLSSQERLTQILKLMECMGGQADFFLRNRNEIGMTAEQVDELVTIRGGFGIVRNRLASLLKGEPLK